MLPVLSENMPMKYWLLIFNVCCRYNPAVAVPPGWPVLRPQSWFPQHPAGPLGLAQRPLFPIQNVTPPLPSATLQPLFQTTPPGPLSSSSTPVSQPLFPVVVTASIPSQNSQVTAAALSAPIPSSTPSELNNPSYSSANTSMVNGYHASNVQGLHLSLPIGFKILCALCIPGSVVW